MQLILVRHGAAENPVSVHHDSFRQLTPTGLQQAEQTARFILEQYPPSHLVSSPYTRAIQTLECINATLHTTIPCTELECITPDADARYALDTLAKRYNEHEDITLVVVCHMNIIAKLDMLLTDQVYEPFQLAEARVYDLPCIALGAAVITQRFVPAL